MLALSPLPFPTFLWPSEEPIDQFYCSRNTETANPISLIPDYASSNPPELLEHHQSTSFAAYNSGGDPSMVKKLNHNASERDRRKMMNNLYSSLRSLLPASDQMKKLSIPATISQVLKYIPELQQQVERLSERKEELLSKINKKNQLTVNQETKSTKKATDVSLVSSTKLTDSEVVIQISTYKNAVQTCRFSEILNVLEDEGLSLINCSSFESFSGRMFYTLHFQVEGSHTLDCEALSDKALALYNRKVLIQ